MYFIAAQFRALLVFHTCLEVHIPFDNLSRQNLESVKMVNFEAGGLLLCSEIQIAACSMAYSSHWLLDAKEPRENSKVDSILFSKS